MTPMIKSIPDICYPIKYVVDQERLTRACETFLAALWSDPKAQETFLHGGPFATVNLNHVAGLVGRERFFKYSGNRFALEAAGLTERDFTVLASNFDGTYIKTVINAIEQEHLSTYGTPFVGRYQLLWVNPMACYPLHIDKGTPHRYHVPIKTNPNCMWLFRQQGKIAGLHMPADGRVWYVNPVAIEHTVANFGDTPRYHLLMTSAI
jgi:hypothetical protein